MLGGSEVVCLEVVKWCGVLGGSEVVWLEGMRWCGWRE